MPKMIQDAFVHQDSRGFAVAVRFVFHDGLHFRTCLAKMHEVAGHAEERLLKDWPTARCLVTIEQRNWPEYDLRFELCGGVDLAAARSVAEAVAGGVR